MNHMLRIRSEKRADYPDIKRINDRAFGQQTEGILIEKLRLEPDFISDLSLIAFYNGRPAGHILFFPVNIVSEENSIPSLSLAPMAVDPRFQKQGIGSELVRHGLQKAADTGFASVVVAGHPEYYPRFGFKPASKWGITSPWELPEGVFMALELREKALEGVSGKVIFSNVFNEAI